MAVKTLYFYDIKFTKVKHNVQIHRCTTSYQFSGLVMINIKNTTDDGDVVQITVNLLQLFALHWITR